MAQTSGNKSAYSLTPGEVQYLAKAHSDIPQFHNFMTLSEVSQSHDSSGELVSFGYHDGGHVRLRAVLLLGPPEHRKQSMSRILSKLKRIQSKPHDNLIGIRGFYASPNELLTLVSSCSSISIMEYLQTHPDHDRRSSCVDVARGLDYLHRHSIVHGAVRGSNVLVKPDGTCFLGEFADEDIPGQETLIRYASWMAPELYDIRLYHRFSIDNYRDDYHGEYKLASDIYALGCTVIEIYTGAPPNVLRIPHDRIKTHEELARFGRAPSAIEQQVIPQRILSALQDIMHIIPHHRPHSGNAFKWLDKPDAMRVRPCAPVNAKGQMRRAAREQDFWTFPF